MGDMSRLHASCPSLPLRPAGGQRVHSCFRDWGHQEPTAGSGSLPGSLGDTLSEWEVSSSPQVRACDLPLDFTGEGRAAAVGAESCTGAAAQVGWRSRRAGQVRASRRPPGGRPGAACVLLHEALAPLPHPSLSPQPGVTPSGRARASGRKAPRRSPARLEAGAMAVGVWAGTGCQEAGSARGSCLNLAGGRAPETGKVVPEQGDEGSAWAAVSARQGGSAPAGGFC